MIRLFVSLIVLLTATTFSQAGELSPGLELQLSETADSAEIKVLLYLQDQVDMLTLDYSLHESCTSLAERHRIVIQELKKTADRDQPALIAELGKFVSSGKVKSFTPHWLINAIVVHTYANTVKDLVNLPQVDIIEANLVPELFEPAVSEENSREGERVIGITDALVSIEADRVWYELGIWGEGVLVANLDTGVNGNHVALSSRWRGNSAPVSECWLDVIGEGAGFPSDSHGHGSHVMGTITGLANNDSIGVAPRAEWIACNAINQGSSGDFDADIISAFEWFADPDGNEFTMDDVPDVVQNSWGVNENFSGYVDCDSRWWTAIDNCEAAGVVVTWSAGNEGPGSGTHRSPADRCDSPYNCFSVGSTSQTSPFTISGFSSRGPSTCVGGAFPTKPEICAPGDNIYSVNSSGGYTQMSGTSMAGPHVAGVVALMRCAAPDLDVITIKEIIMETATDLGSAGEDNTYGHGFINAYEAVLAAMSGYAELSGIVSDVDTAEPLAGVVLDFGTGLTFTTAADGAYSMMFPAGDYTVDVSRFSYVNQQIDFIMEADTDQTLNIDLQIVPLAQLDGVVLDAFDQPLPGAKVSIKDAPINPVITGLDGAYSFDLPISETVVVVCQSNIDNSSPLGPDTYGYRAFDPADADWDEEEVTIPHSGLTQNLQGENRVGIYSHTVIDPDQGGVGTALDFYEDDQTEILDLPFDFPYYGQTFSEVSICCNGWAVLGSTTETSYYGFDLPDPTDGPSSMLAPFWEDLSPQQPTSGNISTYYDLANATFIIEFYEIRQYTPDDAFETFAIHLLDPNVHETVSGDGAIIFWYGTITNSDDTAIGIESPDGLDGLQYWNGRADGSHVPGGILGESCMPLANDLMVLYTTGMLPISGVQAVNDLSINFSAGMLYLDWTPVLGAIQYRIEYKESADGNWTTLTSTTDSNWSEMINADLRIYRVFSDDGLLD
jgi:subtilisin family serine protease